MCIQTTIESGMGTTWKFNESRLPCSWVQRIQQTWHTNKQLHGAASEEKGMRPLNLLAILEE